MIKKSNKRVIITFTQAQANWLQKTAKQLNMSVSKLVRWLIDKNVARFANTLTKEEMDELIKIARTPWIRFKDMDD